MLNTICIYHKKDNVQAAEASELLRSECRSLGISAEDTPSEKTQFCICISGDGNLLSFVRNLKERRFQVPVLGIHGSRGLGFLHAIRLPEDTKSTQAKEWARALIVAVQQQQFTVEHRRGLQAKVKSKSNTESIWALNDLVVSRGELARLISLKVSVSSELLYSRYRGDGMIVASATGSTAYSLAAGGPVVKPTLPALILTPLCPHDASQRPLILEGTDEIQIEILEESSPVFLTSDGQNGSQLSYGDVVEISLHPNPVQWARMQSNVAYGPCGSYFETLRRKRGFEGAS